MNFLVVLLESNGYTHICMIVDQFSKMTHFISLNTEQPVDELAQTFVQKIWTLHVLRRGVIPGRNSKFKRKFWDLLMKPIGVELKISTIYHP